MKKVKVNCSSCGAKNLSKNVIGLNKKFLGKDVTSYYCMACLADYLDVTEDELRDYIEEFKDEGCKLFE